MKQRAFSPSAVLLWAKGSLPFAIFLLIWQLFASPDSSQLPPPSSWLLSLSLMAHNSALGSAIAATTSILVISLMLASVVGFILGLLIGMSAAMRDWFSLLLEYFRAVPPPVLIPVIVLMLGYSNFMKVVVVAFAGLWPVLLNTVSGVSKISPSIFDMARSLHFSRFEIVRKIVIPGVVPSLLLGIRVALPHAIIITLVVEMFTGAAGIGGLMMAAERNFNAPAVFALLMLVGCLGLALTALFSVMERLIVWRWSSSVQR
jgi:ABC-type nitrate/sulfonate/bicarbonate transport system permease component